MAEKLLPHRKTGGLGSEEEDAVPDLDLTNVCLERMLYHLSTPRSRSCILPARSLLTHSRTEGTKRQHSVIVADGRRHPAYSRSACRRGNTPWGI